jgi:hypothetical protein
MNYLRLRVNYDLMFRVRIRYQFPTERVCVWWD